MAAKPFIDLDAIDLTRTVYSQDEIYQTLPHRHEFMQLDRIVHFDPHDRLAVAIREVREDEYWVRGHIPGRPLLPGVLMIESAAQLASFSAAKLLNTDRFLGFGGVESTRFRLPVSPPATLVYIGKIVELKHRRTICDAQAFLDNRLAFESRIIGLPV
jgi:3-hydroxyacyl-[acyl-carrier-protein] dehydratase